MPCTIRLVKVSKPSPVFHDFDAFERLVEAAHATGPNATLIVLLGGEAGLRCGEMIALEWADIDLEKRQLCVQRSSWNGHVPAPKGGRLRYIPLTVRLSKALREHRHLKSPLVLCDEDGEVLDRKDALLWVRRAARRGTVQNSGVHVLRHTFCSHLGHAWRASAGHPGAGRAREYHDDATLHAPESGGDRGGDSAAGSAVT